MERSRDYKDGDDDFLLQENSAIFSILPLLIQDLFHWESHLEILLKFLKNQIAVSETQEENHTIQLQAIYSQVQEIVDKGIVESQGHRDVLVIDENKSVLLAFTFGRTFSDALSVLADAENINIIVYCLDGTDESIVNTHAVNYLQGKFEYTDPNSCYPISVKVTQVKRTSSRSRVSRKRVAEIRQRLAYLELEEMLDNAGLTINESGELTIVRNTVGSQAIPQTHATSSSAHFEEKEILQNELAEGIATTRELHVVDLKSWYCSCDEFQACYVPDPPNEPVSNSSESLSLEEYCPTMTHGPHMIDSDKLIAKSPTNSITSYFRSILSENQTRHLSTVPICSHILALAIAAINSTTTHRYFTISSLANLWPTLT